ncbi:LCP family protein [Pseudonocardia sp. KRD-184]|uniref:LCP family protein n=1 Tax=Pseudonocardia oceani TaxID=2792013 RepID=A0ABS6UI98_9PSEU|nr:LCP family protein [Pseudonocardia oceani]MBW0091909.1 LCP family protein [Pseudonocardia oceani]MBW0098982.1 LCP family protein [Pseudonocardia oceani]MBW0109864.1 LCP family protein [Pseudonocardia oceani]MBW0120144.1 LCP family protein [Pseudonocardia oceani]MBW0131564.1 LCP family protein [Pseudonocardia oceani]
MSRRHLGYVLRAGVVLLSAAVLATTGYGWSVVRQVSDTLVTSEALGDSEPVGLDEEFTALLVGIDTRTDAAGNPLPPEVLAELRAGVDEGQFNTDTIILLHVPAGPDARASAVSIPRDSFVEIAGDLGEHKINAAYRRGMSAAEDELTARGLSGAALERATREAGRRTLVETVEAFTGVTVDHFAEINLAGFVEITEAIGGVPVCLNNPVREERSGVDLPAGPQVVSGGDALAFVRQRRDLPDGDLDRVTRQQAFLAGLARASLTSGALADPVRVERLVGAVTRYVVLDRGWDLDRLVAQLRRASGSDIAFRTIPTGRPDLRTPVDGVAVEVDPDAVRAFTTDVFELDAVRERLAAPLTADDAAPRDDATSTDGAAPTTVRGTAVPPWPPNPVPSPTPTATPAPTATPVPSPTADAEPTAPATTVERPITAATVPCVD